MVWCTAPCGYNESAYTTYKLLNWCTAPSLRLCMTDALDSSQPQTVYDWCTRHLPVSDCVWLMHQTAPSLRLCVTDAPDSSQPQTVCDWCTRQLPASDCVWLMHQTAPSLRLCMTDAPDSSQSQTVCDWCTRQLPVSDCVWLMHQTAPSLRLCMTDAPDTAQPQLSWLAIVCLCGQSMQGRIKRGNRGSAGLQLVYITALIAVQHSLTGLTSPVAQIGNNKLVAMIPVLHRLFRFCCCNFMHSLTQSMSTNYLLTVLRPYICVLHPKTADNFLHWTLLS